MSDVRMRGLCKRFGKVRVIENVDLDIEHGEFAVFVGPSGCGKSTLLRLIAGLEDVSAGELSIAGKRVNDIPPAKRGVSMVFQSYALYPHMTVFQNMAFGLRISKTAEDDIEMRVQRASRMLQIDRLLDRLPRELSGGQRQRVAIGRAIVREPGVFLFDEPLSNLDAALRVQTRIEIAKLHARLGVSTIYVTHDQVEAMTLADKIVLLNSGDVVATQGSVAQVGPPLELYHRPRNVFVASAIGSPSINLIPGELESAKRSRATVRLAGGATVHAAVDATRAAPGDRVTIGVRPEHLELRDAGGEGVQGRVSHVEHLGEASYVYVRIDGAPMPITLREEGDSRAVEGDLVTVGVPARGCHVFDFEDWAFNRIVDEGSDSSGSSLDT